MSPTDYESAIALFLRTRTITRCPTVCAVPTQAIVADADRAAYRDHVAAKEAARLEKTKSLRQLVHSVAVTRPCEREHRARPRQVRIEPWHGGTAMTDREVSVRCCIAGGGPAGMMLGFLLARAGVPVLVLEKHADFLRDFRGDTIHPSTLEIMHELGLLDEFLRRPHQEARTLGAQIGDEFLEVADFSHLPTHCRFIALMPQWDFLDFVAEQARRYPAFQLEMEAEVTDLIEEGGRVAGVRAETPEGGL